MGFDIEDYKQKTARVRDDDVAYEEFGDRPLSDGALRCLRYMCDVETYTVCYLRDVLTTPSHLDPTITTFLTMWNYEEYWHGEVLARVLDAHGVATGDEHIRDVRTRRGIKGRVTPVATSLLGSVVGDDFVALHMSWGAINEWCTHAGYKRLVERENHPTLSLLLGRIMQQETRHIAFYTTQARKRLAKSARARRVTRWVLHRLWAPVGSGVMPEADTRHLIEFLFGGEHGGRLAANIDRNVDRLPGLSGLDLVSRAAAKRTAPQ